MKSPLRAYFSHGASFADVVLVLAVCVALRAIGLSGESVWLDEYFSVAYLGRPTLADFLRDQRPENWEMAPLYYATQYVWAQGFGGGIPGVRLLSILYAAATAGLLYGLGRVCFGRAAGLVAALLFALSPFQIFHGQGLRPYALVTLLGVASAAAFFFGMQRRDRNGALWLGAAAGLNGLLMWTHLFTPLLAAAQGLAFLVIRPHWRARWLAFGGVHAVMLAPVLWWVTTIRAAPPAPMDPPSIRRLFHMILSQDTQATFWVLGEESLAGTAHAGLIAWSGPLYLAQLLFSLIALLVIATACWKVLRTRQGRFLFADTAVAAGAPGVAQAWLFFWLLTPFLALWVLAQVWIPSALQARYALFALPALYLLIGATVQSMRSPACRAALAALVLIPMIAHGAMAPALPMRPAYLEVARVLQKEAQPQDWVVAPDYNVLRVLAFQAGTAATLEFEHLPDLLGHGPPCPGGRRVWVLIAGNPAGSGEAEALERALPVWGHPWRRHTFAGLQKLYLYRVDPPPEANANGAR